MNIENRFCGRRGNLFSACGIFLLSLALYALISPGRIDMIDGQWRFDVAYSIFHHGSVALTDPALMERGVPGFDGRRFSPYALSGSLIATPLIYLSELLAPANLDLAQFFFAMTSPLMGALTLATLYLIYRNLGASSRSALFWVAVLGFATLFLPVSTSIFDQVQNAYFLLISFYAAHEAKRRNSVGFAVIGAIAFVILINFKEAYAVVGPGLVWTAGLNWLRRDFMRQISDSKVIQLFILGGLVGIAGFLAFNLIRFAHPFPPGSLIRPHPPVLGNTAAGLVGLTISPGKGVLWYSPAALLVGFGWKTFLRNIPSLAQGILIASGCWTLLIASLSFYGGDWCWGPRYWVPLLPLLFLAAPFANWFSRRRRILAAVTIVLSFSIQCLAVSVDHQRFFFVRELPAFFWYKNLTFYYTDSALLARISELSALESPAKRKIVGAFRPGPHPESLTYTIFGRSAEQIVTNQEWLAMYPVFSLPRPWPIWSLAVQDERIAAARSRAVTLAALAGIAGLALLFLGSYTVNGRRSATGSL
ncbi:MAG: hypothetical protein ABL925_11575 [Methylococcales bacterium]